MFEPVQRQFLSDAVFDQLRTRIMSGGLAPGEQLPAERSLCQTLKVNRGAVREALKRLEQSGLVAIRHGGGSTVLDYRKTGSLDLLSDLLVSPTGELDLQVARSVMEMRSALAPDAARLAAIRAPAVAGENLTRIVAEMRLARTDLEALGALVMQFWLEVVNHSGNIAYVLAFNSLNEAYTRSSHLITPVFSDEFSDLDSYEALAQAVVDQDEKAAEKRARALVRRGEATATAVLNRVRAARDGKD